MRTRTSALGAYGYAVSATTVGGQTDHATIHYEVE